MLWPYLGAALFLAGALPLTARDVVPGRHRACLAIVGDSEASGSDGMGDDDMATPDDLVRAALMSPTRLRAVVLLASAVAVVTGVVMLNHWWTTDAAYATAVVITLPVLVALAVIDVDVHRLPNRLTCTLALLTTVALLVAAATRALSGEASPTPFTTSTPVDDLRRAATGAVALGLAYLVLALLGGGQGMGLGDVKLAPSLGAMAAWAGWQVWLSAAVLPFVLGGIWGVALLARGRGRHARMPFGPFMIAGTLLALCTS